MSNSTTSWKQSNAETADLPEIPLLASRIAFAVDASGSTAGRVMERQQEFVVRMTRDHQPPASVVMWGSDVTLPASAAETSWRHRNWGTYPELIFSNDTVVNELKQCDMWYLLTDGEVPSPVNFARRTIEVGMANAPVVFVITNRAGAKPSTVDISVGVSVFASASDAAIIFKNTGDGEIHVLAAKGAFETLTSGFALDLDDWTSLPHFSTEDALRTALKDVNIVGAAHRTGSAALDLGRAWQAKHQCLIDVDLLLAEMHPQSISQEDLLDLFEEDAFSTLMLICKTRGLLRKLRDWLQARKERVTVVEIRDVAGAGETLQQLRELGSGPSSAASAGALRLKLRAAHQTNLADYRSRLAANQPSVLLPQINRCLAALTALEKAGYRADILDRRSNRAMRAAVVSTTDMEQQLATLDLDDNVDAFRSTCLICCSDDVVMSLALKVSSNPGNNTTDFALNFPLAAGAAAHNRDVLSAQHVCFQCALAMQQMDPNRGSMYNEPIAAVVPLARLVGVNGTYITSCLAKVFTDGLATGAAGLAQVLMSVILTTMKIKDWAKANEGDTEIQARRAGMLWLLKSLIANVWCRETFDETGEWVPFHTALRWTLKTFAEEGIYSWTVRYPVPGFLILLELLGMVDGVEIPEMLRTAKLMHEMVTVYMARMGNEGENRLEVQRQILKVVFAEFNAEGVPRDMEDNARAINSAGVVFERLAAWSDLPGTTTLMEQIGSTGAAKYASALQYIAFRLFSEDSHQMAKGYFQRAAEADVHMHTAITKPQDLTPAVVVPLFTALWDGEASDLSHYRVTAETIPPFMSPYSPSVLRCSIPGCSVRFDGDGCDPESIRKSRAAHLAQVYAFKGVVPTATNGLPENTGRLEAPTTAHTTLYASVRKSWRVLDKDARRAILQEVAHGAPVDIAKPRIAAHVEAIMGHICVETARGNIYQKNLRDKVVWVLPSFFAALHTAAQMKGVTDDADLDLAETSLAARIEWELALATFKK
ncbi:hypothetical protein GGX14DRAFT_521709 [Mycena pura]|uniref:Uncharacterized protein n=1 Tax=Mycena pura TaxID=153505 RepID=A0AAD6VEW8_9AGAR|nr:hypothetical protein GGX14DRAFT_521709 [Mycena pura]